MRIIAGRHRGRKLLTPEDRRIRPTSDRAREALFAVLDHGRPPLGGARFLDLFCGTGAVGLEAWSRGAAQVLLIDREPAALRLAEANVARLGGPSEVSVRAADASALGQAPGPFDLVFLDPPYRSDLATPALVALSSHGWLSAGARVIVQLAPGEACEAPAPFALDDQRRYGNAKFLLFRHGAGS
jgi:16S rRNA (guanine966-N2)-methyltransferase